MAGYALGGGLSWLTRSHGLAANSVLALEVVTADGVHRRVDAYHDPDLFWALRGGGGNFGTVTTLEFPPLEELPPHLAGRSFVVIEAACQLDSADADRLFTPLRDLGAEFDTFQRTPVVELSQLHMDPPGPVPGFGDGMLLRGLDADVALFAVGMAPTSDIAAAVAAAITAVRYRMAPWSTGRCYLNFAEERKAGDVLFGADTHARLREIKAAYDPDDIIRANQPVLPAGR